MPAATAGAAEIPGRVLDGPSAAILQVTDVSLAADGTGAVAYIKLGPAQDDAFVVRRSGGVWGAPENVSNSAAQDIGDVEVEASNGGRLLVVYRTGGALLKAKVSPGTGQAFGSEIDLDDSILAFNSDANDAGVGYVVATKGANLVGQRITGNTATPIGATIAPTAGMDRAVAVDGAGNAVAAYDVDGGGGQRDIVVRRLTGTSAGGPIEATVDTLGGRPRASQASRALVASDDAGNAWVAFREQFTYPVVTDRLRPLVRRLSGNAFGPPLLVDPGPTPPLNMTDGEAIQVAVAPNGANALASGFIQNASTNKPPVYGASLTPGAASPFLLEPAPSDGAITTGNGIVNGGSGFIAYSYQPPGSANYVLRARLRAGTGAFGAPVPLSNPVFGNVDGAVTPFTDADASQTGVVAYKQGAAATSRVLAATLDIPSPGGGGGGGDTTDPTISRFRLSRSTFRKGTRLPKLSAVKTGTTIRFRLSEAATVRLTFEKAARGRRAGRRCRKPTRGNRKRRRCTRYVRVRTTLSVKGKAGANRLAFQGRLSRRRSLAVGRYRFSMVATDTAKNASKRTSRKRFRLLRAARKRKR